MLSGIGERPNGRECRRLRRDNNKISKNVKNMIYLLATVYVGLMSISNLDTYLIIEEDLLLES